MEDADPDSWGKDTVLFKVCDVKRIFFTFYVFIVKQGVSFVSTQKGRLRPAQATAFQLWLLLPSFHLSESLHLSESFSTSQAFLLYFKSSPL